MSKLSNQENYVQIAKQIQFPTEAFINGEYTPAISKNTLTTINPATGETLAQIASCDENDLDRAVEHSRAVFEMGTWSKLHPSKRKEILINWVSLIDKHSEELAVLESLESGKPICDCVTIDLPETMHCLSWYAEAIDKLYSEISPSGNDQMGLIIKEPVGVVAAVLPWNFPLMMMAWKVGPALAAGNSVLVKPAEQTSMTALYVAKLAQEAGLPNGVLNVLPGMGESIGKAIGMHADIDVVSFTGSTQVGRYFLEYSAKSNLKKIILECGGKSPSVVLSDATDLDSIADNVLNAAFWNMGENCTANSRLIVHQSLKQELTDILTEKAKEWTIGNPLDPNNKLGAMIERNHHDKVMTYIAQGKREGAKCLLGGDALVQDNGLFIKPTIFDEVTSSMSIARDEIFGPVLGIITVQSDEQAIEIANDTEYGLQASIYSSNVKNALNAAKSIKAGTVSVNCYGEGDITTPFGGYKASGFGGRDNSLHAFLQYTETKTIWMELS
jgi:4-(gamma-glutamylamino)butanal dehydrogenase